MRSVLTLIYLLQFFCAFAQPAILSLKNGNSKTVNIESRTIYKVVTDQGNFRYGEIRVITFAEKKEDLQEMYDFYGNHGVTVRFLNAPLDTNVVSPVVVNPEAVPQKNSTAVFDNEDLIAHHLINFNKTRITGKALQLSGLVVGTFGGVLATGNKHKTTGKALILIGSGLNLGGFVTDFVASSHLKKLEKEYRYSRR